MASHKKGGEQKSHSTIDIHKRIQGMGSKEHAPWAPKEIWKSAWRR